MNPRPDLLDPASPDGLDVVQLTHEDGVPGAHLYMEAQVFTPDSRFLLVHRAATAHGGRSDDPEHRYLVCDLQDGCSLRPITHECGARAPSVTPDGRHVYYLVDETLPGGGRLTLKRVALDGTGRETLAVIDAALPGTSYRPSQIYPLSTISADATRLAISCFLGDGRTDNAPWGLLVFDLRDASVRLIIQGWTWCNMHPQYCRSREPEAVRDILIQENHDNVCDARGRITVLTAGLGADIHVIRDDGTEFRNMPWGRDGDEHCQGHQCWRGRSTWAITSTGTDSVREAQLIEGEAGPHTGHVGSATPGAVRNSVSRTFTRPQFYHFATDIEGRRLITDSGPMEIGGRIYLADLGEPGTGAATRWRYLLGPRTTAHKDGHIHPFLSPDGRCGFFNSNESGLLQAYMIRGLDRV